MKKYEKIGLYTGISLFVFMFVASILGFQIERYDTHIKDEDVRQSMLTLKALMALNSFFIVLFLVLKKYKLALFFIVLFFMLIILLG